ncbi:MAG TPA: polyhydroxyalkanoate depolymerase [Acetobacteraceae bacterium]|nr:polyhydroxyalkanoate depolymerase [Acetobacteraceae bacterium]
MIYNLYQTQADMLAAWRPFASGAAGLLRQLDFGGLTPASVHTARAAFEMLAAAGLSHRRPSFGLDIVRVGPRFAEVSEEVADETPFGALLHFRKQPAVPQPRVLVVAPMSGHFATLLRGTVKVLLPDHDTYITDWKNARDIPLSDGRFGLDEMIAHIIRFIERIGPGTHVIAVCQPTVPVLAAVAVMAEGANPAQPRSMTLMAGPIDTRINPTKVNELARSRPIAWFERHLIAKVPWRHRGAGRLVYPGFMQLAAFMSMNIDRHLSAHFGQFRSLMSGDSATAATHRRFYDEYNAVMDLPAEFYLETVRRVFQEAELAGGRFTYYGRTVRPEAIRRTALLTVEGERDDICAIGQTLAALDLCAGIRPAMKRHHLQTGVGHYGVFSGRRWAQEVAPLVREMIAMAEVWHPARA